MIRTVLLYSTIALLVAPARAADAPEDPKAAERKKAEEILEDAETQKGYLTLHLKEGAVHLELADGDFRRSFLLFESVSRGVGRGRVLAGMTLGERLVSFRRVSAKQVQLVEENVRFTAEAGSPLERAVRQSYGGSVLGTFPVAAKHPERDTLLVDLGALFLGDLPGVAEMLQTSLELEYKHDRGGSSWTYAKAFPNNVELEVSLAFTSSKYDDAETVPDSRNVEVGLHYSLLKLPEPGFRPRAADDRVGYFVTARKDFSQPGFTNFRRFANRWRIEKADPDAALSAPRDPLVYWIENTVPHEYRRHVREGILEWNKAFERIGVRDAIEVRQMEEDAEWDPEDARYNTFRWITSSRLSFGAMGPSRVDPRTGEILDADILFEAETVRRALWGFERTTLLPRKEGSYFLSEPCPDAVTRPGGCLLGLMRDDEHAFAACARAIFGGVGGAPSEEYLGQALKEIVMHEVGHTLGLRHNFKASTTLTPEQMHDKKLAEERGLLGSVMEYNSVNLARDPAKQGYYFSPTIGAYDYWAIEYGYRAIDPDREGAELLRIASRCGEPGLQFATDEDTYGPRALDPEATVFDMTSDPLAWCRERLAICEDLWAADWRPLERPGYGYRLHRSAMDAIFSAYRQGLEIAARWVGGSTMDRRHPGDRGVPFRNVPLARQREALDLVIGKGFAPGLFRIPPERLNLLAPNRFLHWGVDDEEPYEYPLAAKVLDVRVALLDRFHAPHLLAHIAEAQARAPVGEPSMTVGELMTRVSDAVWADALPGREVEASRRELQAAHLDRLERIALAGAEHPYDARAVARSVLASVLARCEAAAGGDAPLETRAHLEASRARVRRILDASIALGVR